jgi:hypothetical protein
VTRAARVLGAFTDRMPSPFPLYLPPEASRLFQSESIVRRIAIMARWDSRVRLVELFGSAHGLGLAKALDCELTVIEPPGPQAEAQAERVRQSGLSETVRVEVGDALSLTRPAGSLDGILSLGRVTGTAGAEARRLRPLLAAKGRLALTVVVKVSRRPNEKAVAAWEQRLGAPLPLPREALMALEVEGFEPEMVETASDAELEQHYASLEAALASGGVDGDGARAARAELALYRDLGGKTGVSFACVLGRRKEPGERPPMSRDSG